MSYLANVSKIAQRACTPAPSGHAKRQASRATTAPTLHPHFKNMFRFRPLLSPRSPRKHQNEQIKSNFCHFSPRSGWKYATMEQGTHHQRSEQHPKVRTSPNAGTPAPADTSNVRQAMPADDHTSPVFRYHNSKIY